MARTGAANGSAASLGWSEEFRSTVQRIWAVLREPLFHQDVGDPLHTLTRNADLASDVHHGKGTGEYGREYLPSCCRQAGWFREILADREELAVEAEERLGYPAQQRLVLCHPILLEEREETPATILTACWRDDNMLSEWYSLGREGDPVIATRRTFASYSVDDIDAATRFYGETLGMKLSSLSTQGPVWLHTSGGQDTMIYLKPDHVPAAFTVLNLSVKNVEATVDELISAGVSFERYQGLETDDRGIYHGEGHAVAWFTDPAGNILSVVQED